MEQVMNRFWDKTNGIIKELTRRVGEKKAAFAAAVLAGVLLLGLGGMKVDAAAAPTTPVTGIWNRSSTQLITQTVNLNTASVQTRIINAGAGDYGMSTYFNVDGSGKITISSVGHVIKSQGGLISLTAYGSRITSGNSAYVDFRAYFFAGFNRWGVKITVFKMTDYPRIVDNIRLVSINKTQKTAVVEHRFTLNSDRVDY